MNIKEFRKNLVNKLKKLNEGGVEIAPNPVKTPTKPTKRPNPLQPPKTAPDTKPKAKIKENEKEVLDKIVKRYTKKELNEMGGPVPKADINISYVGAPDNINDEKVERCKKEIQNSVSKILKDIFGVPVNFVNVKFNS